MHGSTGSASQAKPGYIIFASCLVFSVSQGRREEKEKQELWEAGIQTSGKGSLDIAMVLGVTDFIIHYFTVLPPL